MREIGNFGFRKTHDVSNIVTTYVIASTCLLDHTNRRKNLNSASV